MAQLTVAQHARGGIRVTTLFWVQTEEKTLENQAPTKHDINFEHVFFFHAWIFPKWMGFPKPTSSLNGLSYTTCYNLIIFN